MNESGDERVSILEGDWTLSELDSGQTEMGSTFKIRQEAGKGLQLVVTRETPDDWVYNLLEINDTRLEAGLGHYYWGRRKRNTATPRHSRIFILSADANIIVGWFGVSDRRHGQTFCYFCAYRTATANPYASGEPGSTAPEPRDREYRVVVGEEIDPNRNPVYIGCRFKMNPSATPPRLKSFPQPGEGAEARLTALEGPCKGPDCKETHMVRLKDGYPEIWQIHWKESETKFWELVLIETVGTDSKPMVGAIQSRTPTGTVAPLEAPGVFVAEYP